MRLWIRRALRALYRVPCSIHVSRNSRGFQLPKLFQRSGRSWCSCPEGIGCLSRNHHRNLDLHGDMYCVRRLWQCVRLFLGKFHHDRTLFSQTLEIMVSKVFIWEIIPFMAQRFRSVNYLISRFCEIHSHVYVAAVQVNANI